MTEHVTQIREGIWNNYRAATMTAVTMAAWRYLVASVGVFKPLDIVFPDIIADLDFYQV